MGATRRLAMRGGATVILLYWPAGVVIFLAVWAFIRRKPARDIFVIQARQDQTFRLGQLDAVERRELKP